MKISWKLSVFADFTHLQTFNFFMQTSTNFSHSFTNSALEVTPKVWGLKTKQPHILMNLQIMAAYGGLSNMALFHTVHAAWTPCIFKLGLVWMQQRDGKFSRQWQEHKEANRNIQRLWNSWFKTGLYLLLSISQSPKDLTNQNWMPNSWRNYLSTGVQTSEKIREILQNMFLQVCNNDKGWMK